ncbi:hypothetical protein HanRHA438_Chr02g0049911 [Helianthus annuus]|uniref:uncharacterized protein LOC110910598 isoform X1 n=1 Tax=Helianthus annuus TaxID=4232 RepID=UPI000B8F010D|nr:uncharacterized protein LOC110910598 isoform X1 [Helianthus annuus]XP_022010928.1 uncharacterized protein LOC110910598 isoform X2 [Helianthus annuus]KAJ0617513.1 hypothetical protein HanHA89_Chr02g0042691 [Helianthus annuus]KAJ0638774.1 hypothetical protein HanHA300_Chr00c0045g0697001 [Helianthus annuus]KAJ0776052.1 hypothetical protein HanLR1_Chr02g0041241 [Helianthus annuus]KAJ0938443.1 hypothetical protein HanRHA438_Chr02g0049911 [Helianthus annuus]
MQITEITFSIIQGILTTGDEEYGKFHKPYATSIVQFLKIATCVTSGLDYFHNKRMEDIVVDWYNRQPQVLADARRQHTVKLNSSDLLFQQSWPQRESHCRSGKATTRDRCCGVSTIERDFIHRVE